MGRAEDPARVVEEAERRGVGVHYQYDHDLSALPSGAPGGPGWFGRSTWTLSATMDFQKLLGWDQTSGMLSVQQHVPEFGQVYSGVDQAYSNLDCDRHTTVYEAWIQQQALRGKLTLKAGRIDANADFDTMPVAAGFLNSSMGYSPTVMDFPSYPAPRPGVEAAAMLGSATRVAGGEFRTPAGRMTLVEGDRTWSGGIGPGSHGWNGRMAIGTWRLTKPMTRTDGSAVGGAGGIYGALEQSLWTWPLANGPTRTLSGFLQAGSGDRQVNPYRGHLGGGLVLSGIRDRRPQDEAGIAVSQVRPAAGKSETVIDTYYKLSLGGGFRLIPDVQFFLNPGGNERQGAVIVLTPRLTFSF